MAYAGLYPHPQYAEDQQFAKTMLSVHVIMRGLPIAGFIGTVSPLTRLALGKPLSNPLTTQIFLSSGRSVIITSGIMAVALTGRMWGREDIEWKDRTWRLLENKGQKEVDDWTVALGGAGMLLGGLKARATGSVALGALGGLGVGSIAATAGYMAWRYGVKGGKWEEDAK